MIEMMVEMMVDRKEERKKGRKEEREVLIRRRGSGQREGGELKKGSKAGKK
jgi:hypothetical protein